MTATSRTRQAGFNLVETMVASVILSGAVLTLGAISSNAVRDVSLNRHYEVAASVIQRQLSMIDYVGIDQFIEQGQAEGLYEDQEPGYAWQVETEYQGIDGLYLVTITVTWIEGKRPRRLTAQTMLNGTPLTITVPLEGQG
ncbi:MAG: prepilin-type N-terminal cleavage/methylation domain-containing protein [Sedimentisphaerales bacterium]|nr:prepilin-type N-terminal cleavage/methylation domain-containing protein [Sedimentisphaerales bacterium]